MILGVLNMREGAKLLFSSGPRAGFIRISTNSRHFHRSLAKFDESADEESVTESEKPSTTSLVKASVPAAFSELLSVPISRRPVFPGFYKTITIRDENVIAAMGQLMKKGNPYLGIFLKEAPEQQQHESEVEENSERISNLDSIRKIGVVAQIVNVIRSPSSTSSSPAATAIVLPHRRIRAVEVISGGDDPVTRLKVENYPDEPFDRNNRFINAVTHEIFSTLADVAKLNPFFREHIGHHNVNSSVLEDPARLADFVAVLCSSEAGELQEVLESAVIEERLRKALVLLKKELINAQLQNAISKDVEAKVNQRQREYFLHEQLKSIKKELGLEADTKEKLVQQFTKRAASIAFPEAVKKVFDEELGKLSVLEPAGAEFNVCRTYLDWLTQLPWQKYSIDSYDLQKAKEILDEDHCGMEEVKKRILEFIAVAKLTGNPSGKILCFSGPPGVGKTSIGKSIARALGREFFRFSVGGLTDVAEIKGHRRTYVVAMPGKAIQALKKVQTDNPVILIDEVDKIGKGHTGDPASALLELLDPEQNASFLDHYLDVPVDLSKVLFICTANVLETIPGPLLDRMEVISLSGYIAEEKRDIAKKHLIPAAVKQNGLSREQFSISDESIDTLNRSYCRESGVRSLKNQIDKLVRKAAYKLVEDPALKQISVDNAQVLQDLLGPPVFLSDRLFSEAQMQPGIATGLAWTSLGGSILFFEVILERRLEAGKSLPTFTKTGQLGKVMDESSSLAYSYARSFMTKFAPDNRFFDTCSLHLHVPEGAIPKDGPSAGITMTTALLSLALNKSVPADLAMTGELSLTGRVMKIGGVREKVVAAKRSGIKCVILPSANESDWSQLPDYLKEGLQVHFVEDYEKVARLCGFI